MERKLLVLFSFGCMLALFSGCETIATQGDLGEMDKKVSGLQDDFYATSKAISERFKALESNTDSKFASVESGRNALSERTDRLSANVENLVKEKTVLESRISSIDEEIRKIHGKVDELDYKFSEEMKKEKTSAQQESFEIRRDMEGIRKTYNDIISSIASLGKNLSAIQNDLLAVNQSQVKLGESVNRISSEMERNSARVDSLEESHSRNIQVLIDEITRQESEIFRLKNEFKNRAVETQPAGSVKAVETPAASREKKYYTVRKGDSLGSVAGRFNTTVRAVREANKLKNDNLSIGQKLLIP